MGGDPETPNPTVLFTFDDGRDDIYTNAYPILDAASMQATCYVVTNRFDTADHLTTAQAQEMYAAGWDIGNHSHTHPLFSELTQEQVESELTTAKGILDAAGMSRASAHVAYPSGDYGGATLDAMSAAGMVTGRTTDLGYVNFADAYAYGLHKLKIIYVGFLPTQTLAQIEAAILNAYNNNYMVLLLFHGIEDVPSTSYEFATADFQDLVDYVAALPQMDVLTISEWHAMYQAFFQ